MNKGTGLIKKFEGLRLKAYKCPVGVWTIGYGSIFYENNTKVQEGDKITIERADQLLWFMIDKFESSVMGLVTSNINDNQLGALTSFAFNVGIGAFGKSTLLKKVNANPNDPNIKKEFSRWTRAGGQVLQGLVKRRQAEAELYFSIP